MNEVRKNEARNELNEKSRALRARADKFPDMPKMRRRLYAAAVNLETQAMHLGETPAC